MNAPCRSFRLLLEGRLARRVAPERLADLSWHEHLFTCEACRTLLDAEEALESLLASLPEPQLEPALRERVLARLRSAREEERLDRLLDLAGGERAPRDLARSVIQRAADERLDRLLALDVVTAPADLAARTVTALRLARRAPRARPIAWRIAGLAAAAAILVLIAWAVRGGSVTRDEAPPEIVDTQPAGVDRNAHVTPDSVAAPAAMSVSDEMLAALDVLENWDVLVTEDVETLLSTLPADAAVMLEDLEDEG